MNMLRPLYGSRAVAIHRSLPTQAALDASWLLSRTRSLELASALSKTRGICTQHGSWHVAVVGSGPAAFYLTDHLLKKDADVRVSIFERLPVPFGLVRYGVAPDHQEVKNVTDRFTQIASSPRVRFYGNVCVGDAASALPGAAHIPLDHLQEHFDGVVLAYGASADRDLGIPGCDLRGVCSARRFVEWYNGHPLAAEADFGLDTTETVTIVGNGNVALDCARILCKGADGLRSSDIAEHALEKLRASAVRQVIVLGRRGVLHAAFTIKELRELSRLPAVATTIEAPADAFNDAVAAAAAAERPRKRLLDLMRDLAAPLPTADESRDARRVRIQFQRVPVAFASREESAQRQVKGGGRSGNGGSGESVEGRAAAERGRGQHVGEEVETRLAAVTVLNTALEGGPGPAQRAVPISGSEEHISCELALTSVGYKSVAVDGAPFDQRRAVISNENGRVCGSESLYVTGWLKRGPNGVILTNVADAAQTAAAILEDRHFGKLCRGKPGSEPIDLLLREQAAAVVDFGGWQRVDAEEVRRGALVGKPREKIISCQEMITVACR